MASDCGSRKPAAVSEDQSNTCWSVELADAAGYDTGAGHGCRSRWQQAYVRGHHNEEGAAGFPTAFPPWLVVVRTLKKHLISLIATPLTDQGKQVEQSSSLILKALLGNNVGISFMEKY